MDYRLNNHIIGKVYDLTQDNMNAMLKDIERMKEIQTLLCDPDLDNDSVILKIEDLMWKKETD